LPQPRYSFALLLAATVALTPGAFAQKKTPPVVNKKPAAATAKPAPKPAAPEPTTLSAVEKTAVDNLKADTIREITTALSAPEMEGRGTGQAGGDKAAQYIADRFRALGLKPLGDNKTYLQTARFEAREYTAETKFTLDDKTEIVFGKDFVSVPIPGAGPETTGEGELVFAGYGVESDEIDRHDLKGLNLNGKVVVLIGKGRPSNVSEATWKRVASPDKMIGTFLLRGAKGIILVGMDTEGENMEFSELADYLSRRQVSLPEAPEEMLPFALPPILLMGEESVEKLFAGSNATFADSKKKAEANEFVSRPLARTASITLKVKKETVNSSNVVAVLEGTDPKLKKEAVVFSAHYDAYGLGKDGKIYPGAADNALGVGEMIAAAEALVKGPKPRRTVIFLAVTGEEYGLLGAKYWTEHPTWPLASVVADLNCDGMGTEVYGPVKSVVGYGKEFSTLGRTLAGAAAALDCKIIPDPMPEEKAFERSDHYMFVQKGVPGMMVLGGPEVTDMAAFVARIKKWSKTDYHQPTDTVRPEWDWGGARTVASLLLVTGMRVIQADAAPRWLPTSKYQRDSGKKPAPKF
jgi:hypothetical protein